MKLLKTILEKSIYRLRDTSSFNYLKFYQKEKGNLLCFIQFTNLLV